MDKMKKYYKEIKQEMSEKNPIYKYCNNELYPVSGHCELDNIFNIDFSSCNLEDDVGRIVKKFNLGDKAKLCICDLYSPLQKCVELYAVSNAFDTEEKRETKYYNKEKEEEIPLSAAKEMIKNFALPVLTLATGYEQLLHNLQKTHTFSKQKSCENQINYER